MSNASDFVIENGVLKKYVGKDANVTIPDGVTSIGYSAFSWCIGLKSITLPESVTSIGNGAFSEQHSLTSITIPEGMTNIGDYAFSGCHSLTSITIPEGVTSIGEGAFLGCSSLKNVTIPESVMCIGDKAFSGCEGLADHNGFVIVNGVLYSYYGKAGNVVIPEGVTSIGDRAFERCNLKRITIPEGVTTIAQELFENCDRLEVVNIPDGVTEIGKEAFFGCSKLKSIHLPDRTAKIGERAFACCSALCEITVSAVAGKYRSEDGVLFSKDGKKLIAFPAGHCGKTYTVPDHTEQIGPFAFFGAEQLKQITLPQSLKSVGGNAFKRTGFRFATIPKSVAKLPQKAFQSSTIEWIEDEINCIVPFVAVYSAEMVGALVHPVYIGGPLSDIPAKLKNAAVKGFFYALQHEVTEILPYKQSYLDHIKNNSKTYAKQAATDEYVLHFMIEEKLLSQKDIETLLEAYGGKKHPDIIAELLDYQLAQFGGKKDDFSLSDDDPEMKRMMKMAARRETIKDQKGIKGIVFVQTGGMSNFGYYDEYTSAKDMSDLKEYIEKRGGFLRSAVSSNTDYLICNDPNSSSVKSKKAKELGVPVITEDQFLKMANEKE